MKRPAVVLAVLVACAATVGDAGARRRPRGRHLADAVYVPAFFNPVPRRQLFDDARGGPTTRTGSYLARTARGGVDRVDLSLDGSALQASRLVRRDGRGGRPQRRAIDRPAIEGAQFRGPGIAGRFVLVPYQVVKAGGEPRLLCRAGLLLDGAPYLLQRDEGSAECPPAVAQAVVAGTVRPRRFLVEGRWSQALAETPIRSRPRADAAIIGGLRRGDDVDVVDRLDGFVMIHGGGLEGFVPESALAP